MRIREFYLSDKKKVDKIYNEFFKDNEYPDFVNGKFHCSFVVTEDDNDDEIILAGGVKSIAEAIVVTDKNRPVRVRQEALLQALGSTIFIAQGARFRQIHAFVSNDEKYVNHLQKFGFKLIDAKLLVLDFGDLSNG
jgi:hypothetical protein